ncbi:MAG: hypothetical protein NTY31_00435 [Candidatus Falkowbacteria bacterium]|nr:hypothetical protein [Candidatus Falkowbacteria bacterium]
MPKLTFDLLQQEIDYVIANNDFNGAFECYNLVKDWLNNKSGLVKNSPEYAQYNNYLIKLRFLGFNFLNDIDERVDLIKNYFGLALEIPQFDIWAKLETELISVSNLDERDAFKAKMREALEKCDSILISRQKYVDQEMPRKVNEWIKNFVANLGLDKFDKVKKLEYLSNNKVVKILDATDKDKVKILLDIYEKLKISSQSPEGYENSVLMNIDGKTIIFNHGNVEEISDMDKIKRIDVGDRERNILSQEFNSTPVASAVPPAPSLSPLAELEQLLKNYSESSLEHKAISQEISRLKSAEFKRVQKADQKSDAK